MVCVCVHDVVPDDDADVPWLCDDVVVAVVGPVGDGVCISVEVPVCVFVGESVGDTENEEDGDCVSVGVCVCVCVGVCEGRILSDDEDGVCVEVEVEVEVRVRDDVCDPVTGGLKEADPVPVFVWVGGALPVPVAVTVATDVPDAVIVTVPDPVPDRVWLCVGGIRLAVADCVTVPVPVLVGVGLVVSVCVWLTDCV